MITIVKVISAQFASLILLGICNDIIMMTVSHFTGKPYERKSLGFFETFSDSDKWAVLIYTAMFFLGAYTLIEIAIDVAVSDNSAEYKSTITYYEEKEQREEENKRECDACWERYPEEYMYHDQDFGWVCPNCVYGAYEEVQDKLRREPNILSDSAHVLEGGDCCMCGGWAPENLLSPWGDLLCIDCANEFFALDSVWAAVNNYIEYERE